MKLRIIIHHCKRHSAFYGIKYPVVHKYKKLETQTVLTKNFVLCLGKVCSYHKKLSNVCQLNVVIENQQEKRKFHFTYVLSQIFTV